ncbi:cytochrome c family protein [Halovulum dunhuangense]|uniref:Cytochrome c family protein n=1 Tax=Halovulum dunhuangense TaxID=1505036 RepID=A0A849L4W9_9RHOB|nr:cytochrome c family protein [Halovulum dunhuangense]NNU81488.1 cytochrome c family protein [Halovulum dunhuangense]
MNTMEITKIVGGLCGSLLVFLLIKTGAESIIHSGGHGEEHANAYVIEVAEAEPAEATDEPVEEVDFASLYAEADAGAGERLFRACAACHRLEDGANAVGPHLYNVVGRDIGAVGDYAYSDAMAGHGDAWTPENLNAFLLAPSDYVPGTKMAYRGMADIEDRANLIAYLESVGG